MKGLRGILPAVGLLLLWGTALAQSPREWEAYKERFISPDGRVIDFLQGQISHSEGQGYGMLLAALRDDPRTFSLLWKWTQDNLRMRKGDALLAWKWGRTPNGKWAVLDYNNATDGDILVAWSLLQGSRRWKNETYRTQAAEIIRSLRENVVLERRGRLWVLPAYYGFVLKEGEVLNPSYWVLPAFRDFADAEEPKFWRKVHGDSLEALKTSAFGRMGLPADWVLVKESGTSIYQERSRFFGYEAVRTLLHLAWDGSLKALPGPKALLEMSRKLGYVPRNVDLVLNNISLEEGPGGFYAVYGRAAKDLGEGDFSRSLYQRAAEKIQAEKDDYYSHTLYLLAHEEIKP